VVSSPYRNDRTTFQMNGTVEAPRMKAPMVETVLSVVNPSVGR
jgi:hypothetical protein